MPNCSLNAERATESGGVASHQVEQRFFADRAVEHIADDLVLIERIDDALIDLWRWDDDRRLGRARLRAIDALRLPMRRFTRSW